jgi:hypothetical protein
MSLAPSPTCALTRGLVLFDEKIHTRFSVRFQVKGKISLLKQTKKNA